MILEILGSVGFGYLLGWHGPRRRKKLYEEPEPICGCRHHLSYHGEDGECHAQVMQYDPHKQKRVAIGQCACKKYVGPEPMPTMISSN
jgi:transposase